MTPIKVFPTTLNTQGEDVHDVGRRVLNKLMLHGCRFETSDLAQCDCVFAGAPTMAPYAFHRAMADEIIAAKKPVVMFNESDGWLPESDVIPFAEYIRDPGNGIVCYFYREWHKGYARPDLHFPFVTFDLPDYLGAVTEKDKWMKPPQSRAQFESRPLEVFHCQSMHVLSRRAMFKAINELGNPRWVTNDYYAHRMPFPEMMDKQGRSKITVTLEGSGVKCMRHCEAAINSVMVLPGFQMVETYPWVAGENCLRPPYLSDGGEFGRGMVDAPGAIEYLQRWLASPGLYDIYRAGVENAARYSMENYIQNHIAPQVIAHL